LDHAGLKYTQRIHPIAVNDTFPHLTRKMCKISDCKRCAESEMMHYNWII